MKFLYILLFSSFFSVIQAQDFYELETIQTIEVNFAESNWDQLMDIAYSSDAGYIMAESITINGISFDSVGVKYKGNSTYNSNQAKNPWHIELDTYKEHEYEGYTDIKLANCSKDPSMLRDVLGYQILRQYMEAPQANFANLYVNGNLIGLYSNTEAISKKFMNKRFGSKENTRFKCSPPDGAGPQSNVLPDLVYLGQDSADYYAGYELKSDAGWQELIDLCDTLANHTADIEKMLDVNRTLWMLAFDNVIVNLDSYIGNFTQNYYLYRSDYGQFLPVVWDLNESFGVFSQTGTSNLNNTTLKQQMSHLLHINDNDFPLIQNLLAVPSYRRMYLAHVKTLLLENFDNGTYAESATALQTTIADAVQADNNKFYTYNNFISNLTTDIGGGSGGPGGGSVPGITNLMNGRAQYLLSHTDFTATEPNISNINLSNAIPTINETINITAKVADGNEVFLGYRNASITAPFTKLQMFDDGAHEDGAANDGVYGVELDITNTEMEYYIYAENDNIGMFSPRRAEFEFYNINAEFASVGEVVINEFMASNDKTVADQDGEFEDWIELYNKGDEAVDLSGFFLTDDSADLTKWAFPDGTMLAADDYLIVWADSDVDQDGLHANFGLSGGGESVILVDSSDGSIVDAIEFPEQVADVSYARIPNGTGDFQGASPTFEANNDSADCLDFGGDADNDGVCAQDDCNDNDPEIGESQAEGTACDDEDSTTENDVIQADGCSCTGTPIGISNDVVINEFLAVNASTITDQDDMFDDWIELYNKGTESVDLSGYFLTDDPTNLTKWAFPEGTTIASDGYLIIWADEDEDQDGLHANFRLSGDGESVLLVDPSDNSVIDAVDYPGQSEDISYGRYPNGTGDFTVMNPTFSATNSTSVSFYDLIFNQNDIKIYPNPSAQFVYIENTQDEHFETTVTIIDLTGKTMYQNTIIGKTMLDISSWSQGMYIVKTQGATIKLIVH